MLAATRKANVFLAYLYVNSDQQNETTSGTAVLIMMAAHPQSRVSDGCIPTSIPTSTLWGPRIAIKQVRKESIVMLPAYRPAPCIGVAH